MKKKLTPKQKAFVSEYLIDLNATQACIRAGYSVSNADKTGPSLIGKKWVAEEIQKAMERREKRTAITADRVLQEIALLAFSNPQDFFDDQGNLLPIKNMPERVARSIASIEFDKEGSPKIKSWDKKGALELLGRHLKLFTDKADINLNANMNLIGNFTIELVKPNHGTSTPEE